MVAEQHDCHVPSELVPVCPVCGGPMEINFRKDRYFVEDERWHARANDYYNFLEKAQDKKLVLLEYGVGFNTPTIIRFPFERMAASFPDTTLIRVNTERSYPQYSLGDKYISLESLD